MEDNVLDFFPEDEEPYKGEMIIIKFFYFETPARLYAARLKEANIPSFISNTSTGLPFGNGGIGLHIRQEDQKMAAHIIHQLDKRNLLNVPPEEESFRDADHGDILYQKKVAENKPKYYLFLILLFVFVLVILILQFVFNNPVAGWR